MPGPRQQKRASERPRVPPGAPLGVDRLRPRKPVPVFALSLSYVLWDLGISSVTPGGKNQCGIELWEKRVSSVDCGHLSPPCDRVDLDCHLHIRSCELGD